MAAAAEAAARVAAAAEEEEAEAEEAAGKTLFLFGTHRMFFTAPQEKQSVQSLLRFLHNFFLQLSSTITLKNAIAILLFTQTLF